MQMPLVSKFLCYLEAVARRELAGNPARTPFRLSKIPMGVSAERESSESFWTSPEQLSQLSSFPPHPCLLSKPSAAVDFHRNKNPQTHPEASLLVPTESGRKGFESLLEHDSKTQPPLCIR
jgi:hypothetical protein